MSLNLSEPRFPQLSNEQRTVETEMRRRGKEKDLINTNFPTHDPHSSGSASQGFTLWNLFLGVHNGVGKAHLRCCEAKRKSARKSWLGVKQLANVSGHHILFYFLNIYFLF